MALMLYAFAAQIRHTHPTVQQLKAGISKMHPGVRAFVLLIYLALGASFIAGTATLFWEFGFDKALLLASHDSHLFLFFPTLGIVALAAFYLPSCAFVDMYCRYISHGWMRLILGLAAIAVASYMIAAQIAESPYRPVWDLSPKTLAADKSEPAGCGTSEKPCERIALMQGIENVTAVSRARIGLKDFVRSCEQETLVEATAAAEQRRFCFASTPLAAKPRLSTDAECCQAQTRYKQAIAELYQSPTNRSLTGEVHTLLLPLKVFFLLVLLGISVLLAARHGGVIKHYPEEVARIEIGVLVGAAVMFLFPLMSQGFAQTSDALYGVQQDSGFKPIVPLMSFCFGAWALLLLLFFFRRRDDERELAAKLAGVAASMFAVVKYDLIVAWVVRYLGSGARENSVILLGSLAVIAIVILSSAMVRRAIAGESVRR